MSEIAELLQQKVGLSPDQAQMAENAVIEFVRSRVPEQFQGILNQVLGSGSAPADGAQPAQGGLGGLLGAAESLLGERNG